MTNKMKQFGSSKAGEDKVNCGVESAGAFGILPGEVGTFNFN